MLSNLACFLMCMHLSVLSRIYKGAPSAEPPRSSLLGGFFFLVLCPVNSVLLSRLLRFISATPVCWALPQLLPPLLQPRNSLCSSTLGQSQGSSCLFSISRGSLSFIFWYAMSWDLCFMYFDWFLWLFSKGVSLLPVIPSWLEVWSPWPVFLLFVFLSSPNSKNTDCWEFSSKKHWLWARTLLTWPVSPHSHTGFLNLISIWQAQICAGLDIRQLCQSWGCLLLLPRVLNASLQGCQGNCLTCTASLVPHSLKKSSHYSLAFEAPMPTCTPCIGLSGTYVCPDLIQAFDIKQTGS